MRTPCVLALFLLCCGAAADPAAADPAAADPATAGQAAGADSLRKPMIISARSARPERVGISIRSVDVSRFPDISVIIDARDSANEFYPNLKKNDLTLYQDGRPVIITSLEQTSTANNIPVDIVFVIDQTGSMRQEVNEVKNNIAEFTQRLTARGVDCRLGLISFSDRVERRIELEEDVNRFISWIDRLTIGGGGDDNENALEGLAVAGTLKFRKTAQRIVILITDAMFHQKGDQGDGRTDFTTKSMGEFLVRNNIRLFAITPQDIPEYQKMAELTRGRAFNIVDDFSSILDDFSASLTNLYAVHYRMAVEVPPESIELEIRNYQDEVVLNERVPVLEVDKKFIIENILFDFNKASFDQSYVPELRNMLAMLREYPAMHIEIRGHTDYIGSDEYNIALSDARARTVKQFLVQRGIDAGRITTRGMGKSQPIAPNDNELGRQLNRRTEIVITQK